MQIYVARAGKQLGPFTLEEVNRQLAAGTISLTDQGWYEGAAGWAPLSTIPGVTGSVSGGTLPAASAASNLGPPALEPQRKTEPLAILSLILSLAGALGFCCGLFLMAGIAGVVCGHLALLRIKSNPELEGHGLALAGLIIGYAGIGIWLIWALFLGGLATLQGLSETMMKR